MDSNSTSIQTKMSKANTTLSELKNEISKSSMYLLKLKQNSEIIVGKLNGISSPTLYLKEFAEVNSFLLKYITLLMEMNCKFEMMEILENREAGNVTWKVDKSCNCFLYECNNNKEIKQTNTDAESADNMKENFSSVDSGADTTQPHQKSLNEINTPSSTTSAKKISCEPSQIKSNFGLNKHNSSNDSIYHSIHESIEINQVKSFTCDSKKTEVSAREENFPDSSFEIDKSVKNYTANVRECSVFDNEDKIQCQITEYVEEESHIDEIEPLKIPQSLGKEFQVVINRIISPSEFYVHFTDSKLNLLPELEKQLNSIKIGGCKGNRIEDQEVESRKTLLSTKIGSHALYYSEADETWCRVKVTDWCLNSKDDLLRIFLLDYGESKCVSFKNLEPIPRHLMKYPAFAQRCHLYGLCPLNTIKDNVLNWEEETTVQMIDLVDKSENVKIHIVPNDTFKHHPTSLPVLLWVNNGRNESVNKLLVEDKYARALDMSLLSDDDRMEKEELDKWNPMKEDFESYNNSYDLDINDPAAKLYGYVGNDYERVCLQYAKTGKCYKGDTCKKEHMFLNYLGITTDKEEVYKDAFNFLRVPSTDSVITVLVTSIVDVNQFYCITYDQHQNSKENLYTLVTYINEDENIRKMKKLFIPPAIGQIVLAKYSEDNCWYRAKVLESQPENDLFTLIFVDYGNQETVPLSAIRAIEPRYLHLPFQGMQCFIYGVGKNPEAPYNDVMEYLREKILDTELNIEVISPLPGDDVSLLVKVFDQDGTNMGEDLISRKYAIEKEDIVLSVDCGVMPG